SVAIEHVHTEPRIEVNEAILLPASDRPPVSRALLVGPRRHPLPIRSNVAPVRRANPHLKSFNARDLHLESPDLHLMRLRARRRANPSVRLRAEDDREDDCPVGNAEVRYRPA